MRSVLLLILGSSVAWAQPAEETPKEVYKKVVYGQKNSLELGGSLALSWLNDDFLLDAGPSIGWFVADRWELSLLLHIDYENLKEPDGTRSSNTSGEVVFEPSYHFPLRKELLYLFGGLGVGFAHDGTHPEFELVPRVGLNIEIGRSGFLSPAIKVPILVGNITGPARDALGVVAGFAFEAAYTTVF
jgi:hypothetical protein